MKTDKVRKLDTGRSSLFCGIECMGCFYSLFYPKREMDEIETFEGRAMGPL